MTPEPSTLPAAPRPDLADGSPTPGPGFAGLDERTRAEAVRRLAWAALVYAAVYSVAFAYGVTLRVRAGLTAVDEASTLVMSFGSILVGLGVGVVAWRGRVPAVPFQAMAKIFQVVAALGIASEQWNWQLRAAEIPVDGFLLAHGASVPWVGVWIAVFPTIVPLPPRTILLSSLASAATVPAMILLSVAALGRPVGWPLDGSPVGTYVFSQTVPVLICVGIASVQAAIVFRLTRRVSRARRMGSYRLVERLGEGGMGEVWVARHHFLVRPAAVKVVRPDVEDRADPRARADALARFEREAQATAALTSPHTVRLFDFGATPDGRFYSVMERLEGLDLRTLVQRHGPVEPARAVRFLRHACDSLADAHRRGLVHRDVKPSNLFTCRQGVRFDWLKVLDFGLVKGSAGAVPDDAQLTREGTTQGTPAFLAPEMALGRTDVDGRADLYALACVGYWLLGGRLVFGGDGAMAQIVAHAKDAPPPVSSLAELPVSPALDALLLECLAKSPDDRPPDALALDARLEAIETDLGPWTDERARRWWSMHLPDLTADAPVEAPR